MTSYSGFWNNEYGENYSALPTTVKKGNGYTALSKLFANRIYGRAAIREILYTLIGAAAGSAALATHKRVKAERDLEANVLGGARTIESFVSVNRNTTSADATRLQAALDQSSKPVYPGDSSGNGGGGKLGW